MTTDSFGRSAPEGVVVGREPELARLHQHLTLALTGQPQFVFVAGEPGIGKTTLLDVFLDGLQSGVRRPESAPPQTSGLNDPGLQTPDLDMWIGRGQCIAHYGVGEAYLPLLEAFGRLGREPQGIEIKAVLAQYAPTWLAQLPALVKEAEQDALQRLLAGVTRERMLREMAEALDVLTARQPLILVLEDLHWSDRSTVELLAYLLRRQGGGRLLLLGTYRPVDPLATQHPLRQVVQDFLGRGRCEEVRLGLLDEGQLQDYLAERLQENDISGLPVAELGHWLHQRTEGNPLFMVTMVEHLAHEGILAGAAGRWQLRRELDELETNVPETLRQVIEQLFLSLTEDEQQVLEVAGVVGAEFSSAAVAAGSGTPLEAVEEVCGGLVSSGRLIREAGIEEWPDGTFGGRYQFLHALYQNVLYERTLEVRRVQFHRRIGERKAAAYGVRAGEIAVELAVHFERGRDIERTVQALRTAGDNAVRRHAHEEAIVHLRKGLTLLQELPDTAARQQQELALQRALGDSLVVSKGYASSEVEHVYARALELCREVGTTAEIFPVLFGLYGFALVRADLQRALALAERALDLAGSTQNRRLLLAAYATAGTPLYWRGDLWRALNHWQQAFALYTPQQGHLLGHIQDLGVMCLCFQAAARWLLGYPDQAHKMSEQAITLAQELDHPFSKAWALNWAALTCHYLHDSQTVRDRADALLTLSNEHGFPYFLAHGSTLKGWALAELGKTEEGIAHIRQGLTALQATGTELWRSYFLYALVTAFRKAKQEEQGLRILMQAQEVVHQTGVRVYEAELFRLKGEILLAQEVKNAEANAEACFRKALDIARQQEAKSWELRAATSLARLWQSQAKTEEARELLQEIYDWFTEGFDTQDLQDAAALLTELGGESQKQRAIQPALDKSSPTPHSPPSNTFRDEGAYWMLSFDGTVCRIAGTLGMQYLAQLLRRPRQEVHVRTLVGEPTSSEPRPAMLAVPSVLPQRLQELREELAEAEVFHDVGRVERLHVELEEMTDTLVQQTRAQQKGASLPDERLRLNVTRAIKTAIKKITSVHPSLGRYLTQTIKTGMTCSYSPPDFSSIDWQV